MGEAYFKAVSRADEAVQSIVEIVKETGVYDKCVFIITSDHGGTGHSHSDADMPENFLIPWICVGPGVTPDTKINRVVHTYDTAPTALAFLGLQFENKIDGKVVSEVLPK